MGGGYVMDCIEIELELVMNLYSTCIPFFNFCMSAFWRVGGWVGNLSLTSAYMLWEVVGMFFAWLVLVTWWIVDGRNILSGGY